jgi:hypothetical protein
LADIGFVVDALEEVNDSHTTRAGLVFCRRRLLHWHRLMVWDREAGQLLLVLRRTFNFDAAIKHWAISFLGSEKHFWKINATCFLKLYIYAQYIWTGLADGVCVLVPWKNLFRTASISALSFFPENLHEYIMSIKYSQINKLLHETLPIFNRVQSWGKNCVRNFVSGYAQLLEGKSKIIAKLLWDEGAQITDTRVRLFGENLQIAQLIIQNIPTNSWQKIPF